MSQSKPDTNRVVHLLLQDSVPTLGERARAEVLRLAANYNALAQEWIDDGLSAADAQRSIDQYLAPLHGGRGEWPRDSFGDDVAHLQGVHARVVSRESLITDKSIVRSDTVTAAKDRADIATLLHLTSHSASPLLITGDTR